MVAPRRRGHVTMCASCCWAATPEPAQPEPAAFLSQLLPAPCHQMTIHFSHQLAAQLTPADSAAAFPSYRSARFRGRRAVISGDDIDTDRTHFGSFPQVHFSFEGLGEQAFADDRLELRGPFLDRA